MCLLLSSTHFLVCDQLSTLAVKSQVLLILYFQISITLRVYSVSDQPLKTQQPISYLGWTTNLQNTVFSQGMLYGYSYITQYLGTTAWL